MSTVRINPPSSKQKEILVKDFKTANSNLATSTQAYHGQPGDCINHFIG